MARLPRAGVIALFGALLLVLVAQIFISPEAYQPLDAGPRLARAFVLLETGTFGDRIVVDDESRVVASRSLAPAYPAFLAALASFQGDRSINPACAVQKTTVSCLPDYPLGILVAGQTLATMLGLLFAFLLAWELSGSAEVASLTTLLMFLSGRYAEFAQIIAPHAFLGMFAILTCYLLVLGYKRRSHTFYGLAGACAGVAGLTDLNYALLIAVIIALVGFVEARRGDIASRGGITTSMAILCGAVLVLGPWCVRSWLLFGDFAPTEGPAARMLAERVAYNQMTGSDVIAAFVYWLPGFGDDLGPLLFPPEQLNRLGYYVEGSLLVEGQRIYLRAVENGQPDLLSHLVKTYIWGDPVGYLRSTPPLILRGVWATGSIFVIWGVLLLPTLIRRMRATERSSVLCLSVGPLIAMPVIQGLTTGNLPWLNIPVTFVYAFAIAAVAGGIELPSALRWKVRDAYRAIGRKAS